MTDRERHEFEISIGDELSDDDLMGATYKVVETFVTMDDDVDQVVFTHRIELWQTDDQLMEAIPGDTLEEKRRHVEEAMQEDEDD